MENHKYVLVALVGIWCFVLGYLLVFGPPSEKECTYKDYNFSIQESHCSEIMDYLKQANYNMQDELKQKDEEIDKLKLWKWSALASFLVAFIAVVTMILRSRN